ncbi:hypothetical protein [uncultured Nostoc sp.]|uniref:hypothetical protein n=1 Tax=uncultured Nostoc sp. TaxID=340711 RepID=UPI0035CC01D4
MISPNYLKDYNNKFEINLAKTREKAIKATVIPVPLTNIFGWERFTFANFKHNHTFKILNISDVVALLVNPQLISLIQNPTSFSTEIQRILQRGKQEEIIVVPLLIREVHGWEKVLGNLNPLPKSRIAVKRSSDTDGAFRNIAEGLEEIIEKIKQYHQNLQEYREIFYTAIQDEYPLSTQTLNTLIKI